MVTVSGLISCLVALAVVLVVALGVVFVVTLGVASALPSASRRLPFVCADLLCPFLFLVFLTCVGGGGGGGYDRGGGGGGGYDRGGYGGGGGGGGRY